jgi:hypothetical protein
MRPALLLLLAGAISLSFCGCAFMSDEDREFYGRGWVNPKELDTPMKHRTPRAVPTRGLSAPAGQSIPFTRTMNASRPRSTAPSKG